MGILNDIVDSVVGIIDPVVDLYNESKDRRDKAAKKRADETEERLMKALNTFIENENKKNKDK